MRTAQPAPAPEPAGGVDLVDAVAVLAGPFFVRFDQGDRDFAEVEVAGVVPGDEAAAGHAVGAPAFGAGPVVDGEPGAEGLGERRSGELPGPPGREDRGVRQRA